MLVLSRRRDEVIKIGDDIEITVVDIRGDKVRLGIVAPKEVMVHRKEVYEEIRKENLAAAQVGPMIDAAPIPAPVGNSVRLPPEPVRIPVAARSGAGEKTKKQRKVAAGRRK